MNDARAGSLGELVQGLTTALDGHVLAGTDDVFNLDEHAIGFHCASPFAVTDTMDVPITGPPSVEWPFVEGCVGG